MRFYKQRSWFENVRNSFVDYKFEQQGWYSAKKIFMQMIVKMVFDVVERCSLFYCLFFTKIIDYFLDLDIQIGWDVVMELVRQQMIFLILRLGHEH